MASDASIDPRLLPGSQTQPHPQPLPQTTLPSRSLENADDDDSDDEGNEGTEKRRKLNLWKCKQCRDARKKCLPEGRVWPQKCDRCRQHRPETLECSEPQLNTRKRGPNVAKRTKIQPTPEAQEAWTLVSDKATGGESEYDIESLPDAPITGRPVRQPVLKGIKREIPGSPKPVLVSQSPAKDDDHPPSAYLHLGDGEFRLLLLDPSSKGDRVAYRFVTASKSQPMEYEAISYLWGGNEVQYEMKSIELRDPDGKTFSIATRRTIYAALRSLRDAKVVRAFWVDALCVNHSDSEERSALVAMKEYIFQNAANLCFWLGEEPIYKTALAFITSILKLEEIDKLVRDDRAVDGWAAFVALLKNPVFSRLVMVQEVAVARNVTLHCGQVARHYGDLVEAVAMFVSFRADLSTLFRRNHRNCKDLADLKITIAESFMDVSSNALRVSSSGKVQRLLTLESLVSQLSTMKSGNPCDRIFAVLALAKDCPKQGNETQMEDPSDAHNDGPLGINYNKSVLNVYQDFVLHAIEKSKSLDIICRHWASLVSEEEAKLPTWVRPLQSFVQSAMESSPERTAADSLVGLPDHTYYHASRGRSAEFRTGYYRYLADDYFNTTSSFNNEIYLKDAKDLFACGRQLDSISQLGPRASEGIILYEWLELGGHSTADGLPEHFWRTLVADRGPNGSNAPSWYRRAFLYCLQHLSATGDINTNRLIAECEAESSLVVNFLQRVQSVIWNRKFLVSEKYSWIGLAPMAAQVGDIICVLYGCSVPVVLRVSGSRGSAKQCQLVGECYVHGMMDGEALELGGAQEEEFEIY